MLHRVTQKMLHTWIRRITVNHIGTTSAPVNRRDTMATIMINDITHREACCDGTAADDQAVYDANAERIFDLIGKKAAALGHKLVVLPNSTGAACYKVLGDNYEDEESAHEFMDSEDANFWRHL